MLDFSTRTIQTRSAPAKAGTKQLGLREQVPNTGEKTEDIFVGNELVLLFDGDRDEILRQTERELNGQPFSGKDFTTLGVVSDSHRLDPSKAIIIPQSDLFALAGQRPLSDSLLAKLIHLPRIPHDAAEANAMLETWTAVVDSTGQDEPRFYAGYTEAELMTRMRGRPCVRVSAEEGAGGARHNNGEY